MHLVHERNGDTSVLASRVELADSLPRQALGLMFRGSIPEDYAMAFRFRRASPRAVHMLCVPFPLDVIWVRDGVVNRTERLRQWTGLARAEADLLLELPAGGADTVEPGDEVWLAEN